MRPLILVVDDDQNVCRLLKLYLGQAGYGVITAGDGFAALSACETKHPDLAVLDIMLPGMDGWELCRRIRDQFKIPVIFLTARDAPLERVAGLDMGADDYIVKPFDPNEVVARVRARLRGTGPACRQDANIVVAGNLSVNLDSFQVQIDGKTIQLKPLEVKLLFFLVSHQNRVFTREQLLENIWGYGYAGETRTVDVHVQRLRGKLRPPRGWKIKTVWGVGYKFEVIGDVP